MADRFASEYGDDDRNDAWRMEGRNVRLKIADLASLRSSGGENDYDNADAGNHDNDDAGI